MVLKSENKTRNRRIWSILMEPINMQFNCLTFYHHFLFQWYILKSPQSQYMTNFLWSMMWLNKWHHSIYISITYEINHNKMFLTMTGIMIRNRKQDSWHRIREFSLALIILVKLVFQPEVSCKNITEEFLN